MVNHRSILGVKVFIPGLYPCETKTQLSMYHKRHLIIITCLVFWACIILITEAGRHWILCTLSSMAGNTKGKLKKLFFLLFKDFFSSHILWDIIIVNLSYKY